MDIADCNRIAQMRRAWRARANAEFEFRAKRARYAPLPISSSRKMARSGLDALNLPHHFGFEFDSHNYESESISPIVLLPYISVSSQLDDCARQ